MVEELLEIGLQNAITGNELAAMTGLESRDLRRLIQNERLRGAPILSDNAGYFLPSSGDEVQRWAASMFRRAREICRTTQAVLDGDRHVE